MTAASTVTVHLVKPLEKTVRAGHPWIFRTALRPFDAAPGAVATVLDRNGAFLCRGLADDGPIGVRIFLTGDEPLDTALFTQRIRQAFYKRDALRPRRTTALRLISGEGDLLPGLTLDQYGPYGVLLFDGKHLDNWTDCICAGLRPELASRAITSLLFRTKRRHEKTVTALWGSLPAGDCTVLENGMKLSVDLVHGQKTGMFLDHRDSRLRVRSIARNQRVLNLYGYTGGFSVAAGLGGASEVTTVDSAPAAITLAEKNWFDNGLDTARHTGVVADVPAFMNGYRGAGFDLVIADPPSFAPKKTALPGALSSYRLLHASVFRVMRRGGTYIAASCSSHIQRQLFEKTLTDAARFCNRKIVIEEVWGAGADHPVLPGFPEGDYLKVFSVRVG
ncbi:MAG: class I SAM-dependent rRNA methyltransferase [Chitinispirillaceae bacterium]|nr:class I SAM-dependent rRNA methyltransferase [Chitinispirillaceae bacterium]